MSIERRPPEPSWTETLVKAGLSAVPFVGGSLATLVGDIASRHRNRVTEFADSAIQALGDPDAMVAALQRSERVADLFLEAAVASSATANRQKRRAMGVVVAQAAGDEARVDESQLLLSALVDLEAPHFALLSRLEAAGEDQEAVRRIAGDAAEPVVAALNRHGLVTQVGTFGGGFAVTGVSRFGRLLLDYVRDASH